MSRFNVSAIVADLREKGIAFLPGLYTKKQCDEFVRRADRIIEEFIMKKKYYIHAECQYIMNPFRHDPIFYDMLTPADIDNPLRALIDDDYVLINSSVLNRRTRPDIETGYKKSLGDDWHTDSRYIDKKRLDSGFGFLAVHMFEDFTRDNGATHYVPGSHKRRDIPERRGNYEHSCIEGEAGTVVLMDSGIWHRSGPTSQRSRWSAFNLYGPWFMKPYFRFPEMLGEEEGKKLSPLLRRLLHFTSTPPLHEDERLNTLMKNAQ